MRLSPGFAEVPCARCGRFVAGLAFGEFCKDCQRIRARRASQWSRRISLAVTALCAFYVATRLPPTPTARLWAGIGVVIMYLMVRRIAYAAALRHLN
ncbi:MAG TPA: hypothetical protein VFS94_09200 [Gemmatimonadales bacterium]|nr:hypothetical protein [Gemmatimonadales bacterium]